MAWYNNIFSREQPEDEEKLNPAQVIIARDEGFSIGTGENYINYANAYEQIEVVNRAVNLIVDDVAEIPVDVGGKLPLDPVIKNIRKSRVDILLNTEPNPFQDVNSFKRNLIIDLLIDGNIFIYFDGAHLYHLPARNVDIETHEKNFVKRYVYQGKLDYNPEEIVGKARSLKGVLEPFSTQGNLDLLHRAGFVDCEVMFKYNCFEGFLCIK